MAQPMTERWMLYLRKEHEALPWPWAGRNWHELGPDDVATMPDALGDFTRYSPSDGSIDMGHVPADMPHEHPVCATELGIYHDREYVYFLIRAVRPLHPIRELAELEGEDFSVIVQLEGVERGLYFGLNEKGQAIGCVQVWDRDLQPPESALDSAAPRPTGVLRAGYETRLIREQGRALTACFRIRRALLEPALEADALRVTVGRRCYRTSELVSWGSSITWRPRTDRMAVVRLVQRRSAPHLPAIRRLDLVYEPSSEAGELVAHWDGPVSGAALDGICRGDYADYMGRFTLSLNGLEKTLPLGERAAARFDIADGWNRVEVLTAVGPPVSIGLRKFSGNRICCPGPAAGAAAGLPSPAAVRAAFRAWHERHEEQRVAPGIWGPAGAESYCLCHCGVFHALPYLVACEAFDDRAEYRERIVDACERALAAQHEEGWYPCRCASGAGSTPRRGDGGAFTNGSVGETMLFAARLLEEPRFAGSARRAADYAWYRWEDNQNYAAFALWHLAALFELDRNAAELEKAVYYARHFVTRGICPCGAQDGHNYYSAYGNITLKGMARLLAVLPPEHAFRPILRDRTIRFANQILSRQQPDGLFAGRNRKYLGFHHVVPGLFEVAQALPEFADALAPALGAMYRAVAGGDAAYPSAGRSPDAGLAIACMGRHVAQRCPDAGRR